ncbi:MAG TPA: spore germination protein GerW family protein [Candidatus Dormibacteraeota bacterium]|nr:spore germination protein GerW family protein [Candidatus Dormibacteraeota bacterium]
MNTAQNILKDLVGELKSLAKTETVVGAPVTVGEYTVMPISRVSLGVGAGGGAGETDKKSATGEGGGGGGGIRVIPVALVAVRGGELNVHMLGRGASLGHTVRKMPDLVESILDRWEARQERKEKKETS